MSERLTDNELIDRGLLEVAPEGHLQTPRSDVKNDLLRIGDISGLPGGVYDIAVKAIDRIEQLKAKLAAVESLPTYTLKELMGVAMTGEERFIFADNREAALSE